jgi:hypothetical protein
LFIKDEKIKNRKENGCHDLTLPVRYRDRLNIERFNGSHGSRVERKRHKQQRKSFHVHP